MIKITKKGVEFELTNEKLYSGRIKFDCNILTNGYNAEEKTAIYGKHGKDKVDVLFFKYNSGKNKYAGIQLEGESLSKVLELQDKLIKEEEDKFNNYINKILSGEIKIEIYDTTRHFDGYDYPEKSYRIDIDEPFSMKLDILKKAIEKLGFDNYYKCDEIDIEARDNNLESGFYTINELYKDRLLNKSKKEDAIKEIFAKAVETREKQVIKHWSEECNDGNKECSLDIVYLYAMPDGSEKIERTHTY